MQLRTAVAIFVVLIIIVGVGAYYGGTLSAAPTAPATRTVTNTVTAAPGVPTTVTATVTAPPTTVTRTATVTSTVTGPAAPPRTIKIGGTLALTGFFAPVTTPPKFAEAWASIINEQGGIYVKEYGQRLPVKFIYYDDKSDLKTGVELTERLITEDKVDLLISTYSSFIGLAQAKVAERHGVPFILAESWSDTHAKAGLKWSVYFQGNYWEVRLGTWNWNYFEMLSNEGKAKTVAAVGVDGDWARDVYKGAIDAAKYMRLQVVYQELLPVETADFTATITKVKALNPDIVFVSMWAPLNVAFLKQAKDLGLKPREFHVSEYGAEFGKALGDFANGVTSTSFWFEDSKYEGSDIMRETLKRAGMKFTEWQWSALRMINYQQAKAAIEQAGTLDKAKVNEALHNLQIMTINGPLIMNPETGTGLQGMPVMQIQDGKMVAIYPKEIAIATHKYPG